MSQQETGSTGDLPLRTPSSESTSSDLDPNEPSGDSSSDAGAAADKPPAYPILSAPRDGLPALTATAEALARIQTSIAAGAGPIAFDTERAATYRYSNRAYLIQLRSPETLTCLIDPTAFQNGRQLADLGALGAAASPREWVLHAASQDLPCMCELGLRPTRLFDTELAGRLLGFPRVSLGSMIERYFGVTLLKEHSVADWSRRPLPESWIAYAALDVELLIELRDHLADELTHAGKDEWAAQEFAAIVKTHLEPAAERPDKWRHLTGANQVRTRLGLAILRELWTTREQIAEDLDRWPARVLPDHALSAIAALANNDKAPTAKDVRELPVFRSQHNRVFLRDWQDALAHATGSSEKEFPALRPPRVGPPDHRSWERVNPEAHARLLTTRPRVQALAESHAMPTENLLNPGMLRALCWESVPEATTEAVTARLTELGARAWQCQLVAPTIAAAFAQV